MNEESATISAKFEMTSTTSTKDIFFQQMIYLLIAKDMALNMLWFTAKERKKLRQK